MKYLFVFLLSGTLLACASNDKSADTHNHNTVDSQRVAALNDSSNFTTIEWIDSVVQDLGKVEQGKVLEITWRFRNSGNKPLVMNVRPGCGCTSAEGPKEPTAPGAEGVIKATFDTKNYPGTQHKDVYVTANNSNRNTVEGNRLSFQVDVERK